MQITCANPPHKSAGPFCQDEVQDAVESYFEQLSIDIVKTMSQLFCEMQKLQNSHGK